MKCSIITINYNNYDGLKRTINSILQQSFSDFEWIVVDGGSTDGSRELIEQYQEHLSWWCSEPDKGIYNAMNKGISHSSGEYLNFMNSGDWFYSKETLGEVFAKERNADILYGDAVFVSSDGKESYRTKPQIVNMNLLYTNTIIHQASFIRGDLLRREGYDESLKIVSDWKKWIEWMLQNRTFKYLNTCICYFDYGGISSHADLRNTERSIVLNGVFPLGIRQDLDELNEIKRIIAYNPELSTVYRIINKRRLFRRLTNAFLSSIKTLEKLGL